MTDLGLARSGEGKSAENFPATTSVAFGAWKVSNLAALASVDESFPCQCINFDFTTYDVKEGGSVA